MHAAVSTGNPPSLMSRYGQVIQTLIKYGFEDIVAHQSFSRFLPSADKMFPLREGRDVLSYSRQERIRMVCEELGTTFIKFAQVAGNRPDILPEDLITELSRLQNEVETLPWATIKKVLRKELKNDPEEIFSYIDHTPFASASIAQVHRASLKDGKDVALKIQRPNIKGVIQTDIIILKKIANFINHNLPQYQIYQPMDLVKMFEKTILKELRFSIEASNMLRFNKNFIKDERIVVPTYYPEFSTDKVLCMEYINGVKITDKAKLKKYSIDPVEIARQGIKLYFIQIFEHGFFHADPHPGNFMVLPTGKICFLDFGMMGSIVDSDKELLADLFLAVYDQDVKYLKNTLVRFSVDERIENIKELEYDIHEFFDEYANRDIGQLEGQEVIKALNSLFFDYRIRIPSNLLLLLKALIIIEGVGLKVDASYDIVGDVEPYIRKLLLHKYSIQKLGKGMLKAFGDLTHLAVNLPEDLEEVVHKLRQGKLHIEFEHKGLDPLYQKMEIVSNRISFTLVLVAMLLGSSLMVIANIPPHVYNVSVFGLIGLIFSVFFAIRLMVSIIRHGRF